MIKNKIFSVFLLVLMPSLATATVTYSTWSSNDSQTGNYILTINSAGGFFNYNLTVNPWNAEALGLFIDMGTAATDVPAPGSVPLTSVTPTGQVSVFATDTTSDSCGEGCNLNGLSLPVLVGGDWEFVFSLGDQGYQGIQTFSWSTSNFGLTESDLGMVGIRSQQLCDAGSLLPTGSCGGSDKSYSSIRDSLSHESQIPEPATLALLGLGLLGMTAARRRNS